MTINLWKIVSGFMIKLYENAHILQVVQSPTGYKKTQRIKIPHQLKFPLKNLRRNIIVIDFIIWVIIFKQTNRPITGIIRKNKDLNKMVCVVWVCSNHCWFNIRTLTFTHGKNFADMNVAKLVNKPFKTSHIKVCLNSISEGHRKKANNEN